MSSAHNVNRLISKKKKITLEDRGYLPQYLVPENIPGNENLTKSMGIERNKDNR